MGSLKADNAGGEYEAIVKKWGNSLCIRIPNAIIKSANISEGDTVRAELVVMQAIPLNFLDEKAKEIFLNETKNALPQYSKEEILCGMFMTTLLKGLMVEQKYQKGIEEFAETLAKKGPKRLNRSFRSSLQKNIKIHKEVKEKGLLEKWLFTIQTK